MTSDGLTASETAVKLGISRQAVLRLAGSGRLTVSGRAGRAVIIDPASVERLAQAGTRRGRPWTPRIAWAALALLSGGKPDWISSSERSRLKARLRRIDPVELNLLARGKDFVTVHRATPAVIPEVADTLLPTGGSAMADPELADRFGLTAGGGTAEGYLMADHVADLTAAFGLVPDPGGNIILHELTIDEPFAAGEVPLAAVAVDLMNSLRTRERSAGARLLQELLDGGRPAALGRARPARRLGAALAAVR